MERLRVQQGQTNIWIILPLTDYISTVLTLYIGHPVTTGVKSLTHTRILFRWETNRFTLVARPTYSLTYLLTYSKEQNPSWEANRFLSSQEVPRILRNPKVHCRIHKSPPKILSQIPSVHDPTSYFLKIHLNIILQTKPWSPKWSLSFRFPHPNPVNASPLPHTRYMPSPYREHSFLYREQSR